MSAHSLVTCGLVYLSVGSCIWLVLDGLGVIKRAYAYANRRGAAQTRVGVVLATAMVIVGWPAFIYLWLKGMARPAR